MYRDLAGRCGGMLILALMFGAWQRAPAMDPPGGPHKKAAKATSNVFRTTVLVTPQKAHPSRPEILRWAVSRRQISLRLTAALAEADEVLQIQDGPGCPFHFSKGAVATLAWNKRRRRNESVADYASRRNNDVEDEDDGREVEGKPGSIKVVHRIFDCGGKGPADLTTTRIHGCAFGNGTFVIEEATLRDPLLRGVVVAHEYGHNVCNCDSEDPAELMYRCAATDPVYSRRVTAAQCAKYLSPPLCKNKVCPVHDADCESRP